jgi:hypothetical protein
MTVIETGVMLMRPQEYSEKLEGGGRPIVCLCSNNKSHTQDAQAYQFLSNHTGLFQADGSSQAYPIHFKNDIESMQRAKTFELSSHSDQAAEHVAQSLTQVMCAWQNSREEFMTGELDPSAYLWFDLMNQAYETAQSRREHYFVGNTTFSALIYDEEKKELLVGGIGNQSVMILTPGGKVMEYTHPDANPGDGRTKCMILYAEPEDSADTKFAVIDIRKLEEQYGEGFAVLTATDGAVDIYRGRVKQDNTLETIGHVVAAAVSSDFTGGLQILVNERANITRDDASLGILATSNDVFHQASQTQLERIPMPQNLLTVLPTSKVVNFTEAQEAWSRLKAASAERHQSHAEPLAKAVEKDRSVNTIETQTLIREVCEMTIPGSSTPAFKKELALVRQSQIIDTTLFNTFSGKVICEILTNFIHRTEQVADPHNLLHLLTQWSQNAHEDEKNTVVINERLGIEQIHSIIAGIDLCRGTTTLSPYLLQLGADIIATTMNAKLRYLQEEPNWKIFEDTLRSDGSPILKETDPDSLMQQIKIWLQEGLPNQTILRKIIYGY